ncbi:PH domain-containing protein [[Brevibacterium] frigoritolerans]|nr:PH domain-containing protein [Peribacillus frigoritolerans]
MNKRRDNPIQFIYYSITSVKDQFIPLIGLVVSLIGSKNHYTPYIKFGFYLLVAAIVIYSFLKWYNKTFEFNNQIISIKQGVFKKIRSDIPFNRVKSINTSDSLLKRLCGISNFNVELIGGKNVIFVLKQREITALKKELFNDVEQKVDRTKIKKLTPFQYFLLSLTNFKVFLYSISLSLTLSSFVINYLVKKEPKKETPSGLENLEALKTFNFLDPNFLIIMGIYIGSILLTAYIISYGYIILTYGKFTITSMIEEIKIQYGLINIKDYHIPKNQIRSLRIVEPLLLKKFGYAQLYVDIIGTNKKMSSSILLYPILKSENIKEVLETHLPAFKEQELDLRPAKKYIGNFLVNSLSKWLMTILLLCLIFSTKFMFIGVLIPLFLCFGYYNWKYSALSFNDQYVTIRSTKGLSATTLITLKRHTETTRTSQNFLMKRNNVSHYGFAVYSEKLTEVYTCKYLRDISKKEFLEYLTK